MCVWLKKKRESVCVEKKERESVCVKKKRESVCG